METLTQLAEIVTRPALISINETLIIQLLSFLIFVFIINRIMIKPLESTIGKREDYLEKIRQDIVDAEQNLQNVMTQVKKNETKAIQDAHKVRIELEESGNKTADEIFHKIQQDIASLKEKAQNQINSQIQEARKTIDDESIKLSESIMEKVLERRLA